MKSLFLGLAALIFTSLIVGCASKATQENTSAAEANAKAAQVPTADANTKPPPKPPISCIKGNDQRILEVADDSRKCFLYYTKNNVKKRVAWSYKSNTHCEGVRDQMRQSLEKSGYQCRWEE